MQLYMSWYIRSFFGFTSLNILYFFKYSCTNIFHRRSLYTFYWHIQNKTISYILSKYVCSSQIQFHLIAIQKALIWTNNITLTKQSTTNQCSHVLVYHVGSRCCADNWSPWLRPLPYLLPGGTQITHNALLSTVTQFPMDTWLDSEKCLLFWAMWIFYVKCNHFATQQMQCFFL